jgi:SAM-dependent methyltransferase
MGSIGGVDARRLPQPPYELATRVGSLDAADDPWAQYDWLGEATKREIEAALPDGFSLDGRSVLDFGCGAGRTLRHFVAEQRPIDLWGCDIDIASIQWLERHLAPPVHAFVNGERPPLAQPDESFDVAYCISVFTHLTDSWSEWLIELHRILKPGGLLIATFMGEGQSEAIAGEPWDDSRVGMLVLLPGQSWDHGGPMVMHSPWWIEQHWGRLFEVAHLQEHGFAASPGQGHGVVTLVKKPVSVTIEELQQPSDDPREATALSHNVEKLCRELEDLRPRTAMLHQELERARSTPSRPGDHGGRPSGQAARQAAVAAVRALRGEARDVAARAARHRRRQSAE